MTVKWVAAACFLVASLVGCAGKDTSHDVPPPGGTPKLGVPKFIKQKNGVQ